VIAETCNLLADLSKVREPWPRSAYVGESRRSMGRRSRRLCLPCRISYMTLIPSRDASSRYASIARVLPSESA
jgi:hypothetical protein